MAEDTDDTPRPLAEISHGPSAFEAFLDRNQKGMIALAILIVVATSAWIVIRGIKQSAETTAGAMLSEAAAVPDLEKLIGEYPESAAAGSAQVLVSQKQWENGEQDAAIETLRSFIAADPDHAAIPSAKASLACRLKQQGKNAEAETLFKELADSADSRFIAPFALIALGDLAKADGRLDDAEDAYKRAQNDFGTNQFSRLAGEHLKLLHFTAPVEIEAPPTPAPDAGLENKIDDLKFDATSGASVPGSLEGNPLGNILSGDASMPVDPVDEQPAEDPAPPVEDPSETPAEGESN
ncbi:tetratricopeptide repeat protein [Luteolibacter marinus]|uniref:tetratricopeptide repeat protein n=1 Tax=Luteolibacter marinus TaxID=2776705 RepID=UPI0018692054|nr:tetratricopeptide repeat protein [Luteolibacter marinus]